MVLCKRHSLPSRISSRTYSPLLNSATTLTTDTDNFSTDLQVQAKLPSSTAWQASSSSTSTSSRSVNPAWTIARSTASSPACLSTASPSWKTSTPPSPAVSTAVWTTLKNNPQILGTLTLLTLLVATARTVRNRRKRLGRMRALKSLFLVSVSTHTVSCLMFLLLNADTICD